MNENQLKAVKDAIASVFVPDGGYNIEEGMKLEQASKAAIAASDAKYLPILVEAMLSAMRKLQEQPERTDKAHNILSESLAQLPEEHQK